MAHIAQQWWVLALSGVISLVVSLSASAAMLLTARSEPLPPGVPAPMYAPGPPRLPDNVA